MPDQNSILLQTKLHRPPITRRLIVRSRLIEQLNSNINHPLTLVCAPAGFGKTTLVCTWLEHMAAGQDENATSLPSAWLSLDENDSDLNLFMRYFIPEDTILVMCRSGGRSAMAVNALAKAGFTKVHNIIDGFEGDKVEDPESIYHGMRMRNGWKISVPWTYHLDPQLVWLPSEVELDTLRDTLDL